MAGKTADSCILGSYALGSMEERVLSSLLTLARVPWRFEYRDNKVVFHLLDCGRKDLTASLDAVQEVITELRKGLDI